MAKQNYFNGRDFFRIARLIDVENEKDFEYLSASIVFVLARITLWDKSRFKDDLFRIRPDPVQRGIRMLLSSDDQIDFRRKYPDAIEFIRKVSRDSDFKTMTSYIIDNIGKISRFAGF